MLKLGVRVASNLEDPTTRLWRDVRADDETGRYPHPKQQQQQQIHENNKQRPKRNEQLVIRLTCHSSLALDFVHGVDTTGKRTTFDTQYTNLKAGTRTSCTMERNPAYEVVESSHH